MNHRTWIQKTNASLILVGHLRYQHVPRSGPPKAGQAVISRTSRTDTGTRPGQFPGYPGNRLQCAGGARMIGSRALQLAMGAPFLVKLEESDLERIKFNPIEIAKLEFNEGIIPITVRRPLPVRKTS